MQREILQNKEEMVLRNSVGSKIQHSGDQPGHSSTSGKVLYPKLTVTSSLFVPLLPSKVID